MFEGYKVVLAMLSVVMVHGVRKRTLESISELQSPWTPVTASTSEAGILSVPIFFITRDPYSKSPTMLDRRKWVVSWSGLKGGSGQLGVQYHSIGGHNSFGPCGKGTLIGAKLSGAGPRGGGYRGPYDFTYVKVLQTADGLVPQWPQSNIFGKRQLSDREWGVPVRAPDGKFGEIVVSQLEDGSLSLRKDLSESERSGIQKDIPYCSGSHGGSPDGEFMRIDPNGKATVGTTSHVANSGELLEIEDPADAVGVPGRVVIHGGRNLKPLLSYEFGQGFLKGLKEADVPVLVYTTPAALSWAEGAIQSSREAGRTLPRMRVTSAHEVYDTFRSEGVEIEEPPPPPPDEGPWGCCDFDAKFATGCEDMVSKTKCAQGMGGPAHWRFVEKSRCMLQGLSIYCTQVGGKDTINHPFIDTLKSHKLKMLGASTVGDVKQAYLHKLRPLLNDKGAEVQSARQAIGKTLFFQPDEELMSCLQDPNTLSALKSLNDAYVFFCPEEL